MRSFLIFLWRLFQHICNSFKSARFPFFFTLHVKDIWESVEHHVRRSRAFIHWKKGSQDIIMRWQIYKIAFLLIKMNKKFNLRLISMAHRMKGKFEIYSAIELSSEGETCGHTDLFELGIVTDLFVVLSCNTYKHQWENSCK